MSPPCTGPDRIALRKEDCSSRTGLVDVRGVEESNSLPATGGGLTATRGCAHAAVNLDNGSIAPPQPVGARDTGTVPLVDLVAGLGRVILALAEGAVEGWHHPVPQESTESFRDVPAERGEGVGGGAGGTCAGEGGSNVALGVLDGGTLLTTKHSHAS